MQSLLQSRLQDNVSHLLPNCSLSLLLTSRTNRRSRPNPHACRKKQFFSLRVIIIHVDPLNSFQTLSKLIAPRARSCAHKRAFNTQKRLLSGADQAFFAFARLGTPASFLRHLRASIVLCCEYTPANDESLRYNLPRAASSTVEPLDYRAADGLIRRPTMLRRWL